MTTKELTESYLYFLFNDADHIRQLVLCAQADMKSGRFDSALEVLNDALRPAGLIEMRLNDAIRAIEKARLASQPQGPGDGNG